MLVLQQSRLTACCALLLLQQSRVAAASVLQSMQQTRLAACCVLSLVQSDKLAAVCLLLLVQQSRVAACYVLLLVKLPACYVLLLVQSGRLGGLQGSAASGCEQQPATSSHMCSTGPRHLNQLPAATCAPRPQPPGQTGEKTHPLSTNL